MEFTRRFIQLTRLQKYRNLAVSPRTEYHGKNKTDGDLRRDFWRNHFRPRDKSGHHWRDFVARGGSESCWERRECGAGRGRREYEWNGVAGQPVRNRPAHESFHLHFFGRQRVELSKHARN